MGTVVGDAIVGLGLAAEYVIMHWDKEKNGSWISGTTMDLVMENCHFS